MFFIKYWEIFLCQKNENFSIFLYQQRKCGFNSVGVSLTRKNTLKYQIYYWSKITLKCQPRKAVNILVINLHMTLIITGYSFKSNVLGMFHVSLTSRCSQFTCKGSL